MEESAKEREEQEIEDVRREVDELEDDRTVLVATFQHRKLLASQTDWFGYKEKFYMCRRGCKRETLEGLSTWQRDRKIFLFVNWRIKARH